MQTFTIVNSGLEFLIIQILTVYDVWLAPWQPNDTDV